MKEVMVKFIKADVANYYFDNNSFDIRILYEVDGAQRQLVKHITKDDRDVIALAENLLLETRHLEKRAVNFAFNPTDPLLNFVNVRILDEDEVPERLARFVTKVMNNARTNAMSSSIPKYQLRDNICKLSSTL